MTEDDAAGVIFEALTHHENIRLRWLNERNEKVAHYTSAANALSIIRGRTLWLRNAALMNDFSEIAFGKQCLVACLRSSLPKLEAAFAQQHSGLLPEVIQAIDNVDHVLNTQTYLTSFAQHHADDELGRLSMWRAYGGPVAGVAIVFNTEAFGNEKGQMNVFGHPVNYGPGVFNEVFEHAIGTLAERQDLIAALSRDRLRTILFHTFQDLMLTTKHQGFIEEQEWRVIYSPFRFPSAFVEGAVEVVGGIPQMVYKVPLRDQPSLHMPELEMDKLIHRVIVGPCQYPQQVAFALHQALDAIGVQAASDRIKISGIPLRQQGP